LLTEYYNGSLITLVPKHDSAIRVYDFRPISLLNTLVKIITKLLANRLQMLLPQIIRTNQYVFIKHRCIQDCLAWSLLFLHLCHQSKREIVILKLDFEKAFDKVEHNLMIRIMEQKGFPDKRIQWMHLIFNSGTFAVILNGVKGKTFHFKRGVRQGAPSHLSFLFWLLISCRIFLTLPENMVFYLCQYLSHAVRIFQCCNMIMTH